MTLEVVAILLTFVVHLAGAAVLVWALFAGERVDWRSVLRPGDDDGRGRRRRPDGPDSPPPLPDAGQSPERFREPGRLADRRARPPRRLPAAPGPVPARERERERDPV